MVAHLPDKSSHFNLHICKMFYCVGNTLPCIFSFHPYNKQDKYLQLHFTDKITEPQKSKGSCAKPTGLHAHAKPEFKAPDVEPEFFSPPDLLLCGANPCLLGPAGSSVCPSSPRNFKDCGTHFCQLKERAGRDRADGPQTTPKPR